MILPLNLPHNPTDSENEKLEFQLKQFGTYAYLTTGLDVFQIVFGNDSSKIPTKFNLNKLPSFPETWFVFSPDYFPMLFVTDDAQHFDFIFTESLSSLSEKNHLDINKLEKKETWDKNSEQLKKNYHTFLRQSSKPKERLKSLLNLAKMAFVNSLDEAKIANLYFEGYYTKSEYNFKNKIQAGNLVNETAFEYFEAIKPIFEELRNCSLAHQFFFSTILATEMLRDIESGKDVLTDATKTSFINKINSLWGFTKDLVAGIKELAKNIREHSNPAIGVISVRLFRLEKWIQTKALLEDKNNVYNNFHQHLLKNNFNDESSIIEINVIDIGKSGVIPTLIKNTESVFSAVKDRNFEIEKLIKEDIENLKTKEIGFHNLLNTSAQQLNQQSKRSIAHFGLLTLSKLIAQNNGLIVASSQNNYISHDRESLCIPDLAPDYSHPIKIGTNYNIVLPINPLQSYATHLPHKINLPSETSAKDIKGVEELFKYELAKLAELKNGLSFDASSKYLIEINFEITILKNRDEEDIFWDKIATDIALLNNITGINYAFCFNLLNVTINESQLFRLLGKSELNFPSVPFIILNIPNECYQKLIKINGEFHSLNPNLAYWNESISTLVYSYQKIRDDKFFFSDVLWGQTRSDFAYLNHFVSLTAFNSTSLLNKDNTAVKKLIVEAEKANPNTEMFFLNNNNLLPLELILKSSDKTTIFEDNIRVLLKNELKA